MAQPDTKDTILDAAETLASEHGIEATVVDVRSLVPLDTQTILLEVSKTGRLVTVEENPRLCGWGAEIASIVADEIFWDLDGPVIRITTPLRRRPDGTFEAISWDTAITEIAERIRRMTGLPYSFAAHAKDLYTAPAELLARRIRQARFVVACHGAGESLLRTLAGTEHASSAWPWNREPGRSTDTTPNAPTRGSPPSSSTPGRRSCRCPSTCATRHAS